MPKRNDGNEQDLRVRPDLDAPSLDQDNPFTGARPDGADECDEHGNQIDIPPDPPVTTPEEPLPDYLDTSVVCPRGFDNLAMDNLIITALKNHFSQPDCIFYDNVKPFIWLPDANESKIRIVMNTNFDAAQSGQMPALVVKRGRQKMQRAVMGDLGERLGDDGNAQSYVRFQQGSHRILCLATADGFSEALAYEVYDFFNKESPVLRSYLPIHDFQVDGMSELGILEDLGQTFAVAIDILYVFEYGWTVEFNAPTLARSAVSLTATLQQTGE